MLKLRKVSTILVSGIALFYLYSGITKIITPQNIINTHRTMAINIINIDFELKYLLMFTAIVTFWEIAISLYFLQLKNLISLTLLLCTNTAFIGISIYLQKIGGLINCGCFGMMSKYIYKGHIPLLIIFNVILSLSIIINLLNNKQYVKSEPR
jgi:hypothetical protein